MVAVVVGGKENTRSSNSSTKVFVAESNPSMEESAEAYITSTETFTLSPYTSIKQKTCQTAGSSCNRSYNEENPGARAWAVLSEAAIPSPEGAKPEGPVDVMPPAGCNGEEELLSVSVGKTSGSSEKVLIGNRGSVFESGESSDYNDEDQDDGDDDDEDVSAIAWRNKLWSFLDDPASSRGAFCFAVFVMLLIVVSCTAFCLETLPQFYRPEGEEDAVWKDIEFICIVSFTVEYVLRILSCPNLLTFLREGLNMIDLLAIAPYYLKLVMNTSSGGSSAVFRVVRLVRVFRVFKLSRYLAWVRVFVNALTASAQPLAMLLFIMIIGVVVFSSAMHFAERGTYNTELKIFIRDDGLESPFYSIPATFWWCMVTITTVGYGDEVPITPWGKVVACCTSLSGVLVLAIPITVISSNFNEEYLKMMKHKANVRARMLLLKSQFRTNRNLLDAMNDEVLVNVRRASDDLQEQLARQLEESRKELMEEVQDLVSIAYSNMTRTQKVKVMRILLRRQAAMNVQSKSNSSRASFSEQRSTTTNSASNLSPAKRSAPSRRSRAQTLKALPSEILCKASSLSSRRPGTFLKEKRIKGLASEPFSIPKEDSGGMKAGGGGAEALLTSQSTNIVGTMGVEARNCMDGSGLGACGGDRKGLGGGSGAVAGSNATSGSNVTFATAESPSVANPDFLVSKASASEHLMCASISNAVSTCAAYPSAAVPGGPDRSQGGEPSIARGAVRSVTGPAMVAPCGRLDGSAVAPRAVHKAASLPSTAPGLVQTSPPHTTIEDVRAMSLLIEHTPTTTIQRELEQVQQHQEGEEQQPPLGGGEASICNDIVQGGHGQGGDAVQPITSGDREVLMSGLNTGLGVNAGSPEADLSCGALKEVCNGACISVDLSTSPRNPSTKLAPLSLPTPSKKLPATVSDSELPSMERSVNAMATGRSWYDSRRSVGDTACSVASSDAGVHGTVVALPEAAVRYGGRIPNAAPLPPSMPPGR